LGVTTVGQLAALPSDAVSAALGKSAGRLVHDLAWGRDPRQVVADRAVKSIGHEETYPVDVVEREELERRLVAMADSVATRVRRDGSVARTVTLKLRYGDFTTLTRSHTFDRPQTSGPSLWCAAKALLEPLDLKGGVRLLGLSASGLVPVGTSPGEQLQLELGLSSRKLETAALWGDSGDDSGADAGPGWARASQAVDAVRARFGQRAVGPAVTLHRQDEPGQIRGMERPARDAREGGND
jgi:DNA polymerase-4